MHLGQLSTPLASGLEPIAKLCTRTMQLMGDAVVRHSVSGANAAFLCRRPIAVWRPELGLAIQRIGRTSTSAGGTAASFYVEAIRISADTLYNTDVAYHSKSPLFVLSQFTGPGTARLISSGRHLRFIVETAASTHARELQSTENGAWRDEAQPCIMFEDWFAATYVPINGLKTVVDSLNTPTASLPLTPAPDEFSVNLSNVLRVIGDFACEYKPWLRFGVKEISPFAEVAGGSFTSSCSGYPGHVCMSMPSSIPSAVANLIHECSHQIFFLVAANVRLVEKESLHYSILRNTERPLSMILLGFHAIVNALIALTLLHVRGYRDPMMGEEYETTIQKASSLYESLSEAGLDNLTESGRAVFAPLAAGLREVQSLDKSAMMRA